MNGQLPPIDPTIREQLTRRSAGRLPHGLVAEVSTALDAVREPRARVRWPRVTWRAHQLAGAATAVALVAILALAVFFPFSHARPAGAIAGYPADRPLTTAELASLLAGPELAPNTTVVASVTVDSRQDVCPMNSRMTFGVIRGIDPQVCVVGAIGSSLDGPTGPGTFAFRILARGVVMLTETTPSDLLGLLGEITPASSSRLAFRVAEDWPVAAKTFLVEGWLGATGLPRNIAVSCAVSPTAGDVLDPSDADCPWTNWLSDDRTAPLIHSTVAGGTLSSDEAISLHGNARYVEAGGMRLIDSIDHAAPVHGVFVVRSVTGPCPGDPLTSSRGCTFWRVLARVADEPLQVAGTPAATRSSTAVLSSTPSQAPAGSP